MSQDALVGMGTFLYFWDARDGPAWLGWWLSPAVGDERFLAFAPGDTQFPEECAFWRAGPHALDVRVARIDDCICVRAPNLGFEGAYVKIEHPHAQQVGRHVYQRSCDLDTRKQQLIDEMGVVIYEQDLTLADFPPRSSQDRTQAALAWVSGVPVVQGTATPADTAAEPQLLRSVRVESAADLAHIVTKVPTALA